MQNNNNKNKAEKFQCSKRNSVVSINGNNNESYNAQQRTLCCCFFLSLFFTLSVKHNIDIEYIYINTNKKRCNEMEINKTTLSVYYTARLFGFAPYAIEQNKLNQIIQVKFSRFLCIYSVTLLIVLAALTNYGLYFDATSPIPIR